MSRIQTPKTWAPEGTMPTPGQWRAWFLACTPEEQQHLAELVLHDAEARTRCLMEDHDDLLSELLQAQASIRRALGQARRYRLAWLSARRWRRAYRHVMGQLGRPEDRP